MGKQQSIRFFLVVAILFGCILQLKAQKTEFELQWDSLMNVYQTTKDDSVKGYIAMNFARWKMGDGQNTGDWDEAIKWASSGVYYSKKGNFRYGIRRCNWQLGRCWMLKGNYPEAIKYFEEFLNASLKQNVPYATIVAYSWINDCYMLLGDYPGALKNIESGIQTLKSANEDEAEYLPGFISKRGDIYVKMNNFQEALLCYEKLFAYNPTDSMGDIHGKIGTAQIGLKKYDEALKNLQIAVERLPRLFDLYEVGQYDTAYNGILGSFLLKIGDVYCKLGSIKPGTESINAYKEAINYLNKSVTALKEGAGGKEDLMSAYSLLKQACEATNDYENALRYNNLFTSIKDSIYNKTTYLKLADQKIKFETEKAAAVLQAKQEKERIEQEALSYKMLADQKLEDEIKLADEKINHEQSMSEEKLRSEKSITAEKIKQEKLRVQKQQANNLLLMGLILVVMTSVFLILYLRQKHEKKRAVEKAETIHQMAELELQSLRSQLNPHFMFNSLNSIQTLIMKEQTDRSQSYLSRFARLLRLMLENTEIPFIPLQKEIDFLQLYLVLESLRVPDMQYSISIDPVLNTEKILIPNMILQPYAENSIWHGLSHKEIDKQLQIRISKENGSVIYEIEDNGVGRKKATELKSVFRKQHQSKGMELLSKRLNLLNKEYGSSIQTGITDVMKNNEVAGTLVTIKIPVILSESLQN